MRLGCYQESVYSVLNGVIDFEVGVAVSTILKLVFLVVDGFLQCSMIIW